MLFKNLTVYKFEKPFLLNAEQMHAELSGKPFVDCLDHQRESMGWVPPLGKHTESYTHSANGFTLLTMALQERLLPASVVLEELGERIEEIQDRESRKVGSKEKKELREQIEDELLPRAFTRTRKIQAYIGKGLLVVNTASTKQAETLITLLRKTIGSLPVVPLDTASASPVLTQCVANDKLPASFAYGDECELKGSGDNVGVASFKKHEIGTDEVKSNIGSGKHVSKLGIVWDEKISFVVDATTMQIKKVKFIGLLEEKLNDQDPQSHEEQMDIEFTIMTGELDEMLAALSALLGCGIEEADTDTFAVLIYSHPDLPKKVFIKATDPESNNVEAISRLPEGSDLSLLASESTFMTEAQFLAA